MNRKQELINELQQNEHIIHVLPVEELEKEYIEYKKTTKTVLQHVAPAKDAAWAARLIYEVGGITPGQVKIKQYANKQYVIFKGRPGDRRIFKGTRYLTDHPTVVRMAVGPKAIVKSAKGGFVLTAVLCVGIEIFDYIIRDTALLSELLGTITGDLIKIGLSSIAGLAAGIAVGSAAIIGTTAAAPIIAAIAVGLLVGLALDEIDEHFGATQALIRAYSRLGHALEEIKSDIEAAKYEINRNLNFLERNPQFIPCLFGPCAGIRGY